MGFREKIEPHVQAKVPSSAKQKKFDRLIRTFFPVTGDIENWKRQLLRLVNPGGKDVTDRERAITGAMIQRILASGVFEELTELRARNATRKDSRLIRHIPIEHWSHKGEMTDTAHACTEDVNAIVAAALESNSTGSRFFMEGVDVSDLLTPDALVDSTRWTYEKRGITSDPVEAKGLTVARQTYPWVFDPRYSVYGTEHQAFFEVHTRYSDSKEYADRVCQVSVNTFKVLFQQLLREQVAVERVLDTLSAGEEGYLVYGAGHTKSVERYVRTRRYRGVTHEIVVPKGLVIR